MGPGSQFFSLILLIQGHGTCADVVLYTHEHRATGHTHAQLPAHIQDNQFLPANFEAAAA